MNVLIASIEYLKSFFKLFYLNLKVKSSIEADVKATVVPTQATVSSPPPPPPKSVEKEVFEKILGNDSLMKKITQYGIQDELAKSRPANGQVVTVDYEAYLYVNEEKQKLVDNAENLKFILGDGDVINGKCFKI